MSNTTTILQKRMEEGVHLAEELLASPKYYFSELKPSVLPDKEGVYAIFHKDTGETLYVGRTRSIQKRLKQHLNGPGNSAQLRKYLVGDKGIMPPIASMKQAENYLKENCYFQFLSEKNSEERGRIEGLLSYLLKVRYIETEH